MSVHATVRALKENDEDFEWYPTTEEIIAKVVRDIMAEVDSYHYTRRDLESVLDIGAGDGRVLKAIQAKLEVQDKHGHKRTEIECFAIEKAMHHLSNMPKDITVIGTDFEQQTLVDKPVGVVFCNPPYSVFEEWMLKIVREASSQLIYLVVPRRWHDSEEIQLVIKRRAGEVKSLGEFDFEDADRRASAKVEVIRIEFADKHKDAFNSVLEDMMPEFDVFNVELPEDDDDEKIDRELFKASENLVDVLVDSYDRDLLAMLENYKAALRIDRRVLKEIGVHKAGVLDAIRQKIKGLKGKYWKALFDEMSTIKERLATKQRQSFLRSLSDKVTIDFTANNVYSILIWVSKWANDYFDEQLIELFQSLSNHSNVVKYKSNERVWTKADWRYRDYQYNEREPKPSHYKLEYRMVLTHGGISSSSWSFERDQYRGLASNAYELLSDIVTVANNLGFACKDGPGKYRWESNKQNVLTLNNGQPLVAVRAFKNGNMHLHFNPKVMLAINVEAGRLLKWIRNPAEACEEMQVTGEEAKQVVKMFGSSFRISPDAGMLRLGNSAECVSEAEVESEPVEVSAEDTSRLFDDMFAEMMGE